MTPHDGQGGGEWLCARCRTRNRTLVTSFSRTASWASGLMQRDRAFANYEDLEARYELVPERLSLTPTATTGRVELPHLHTGRNPRQRGLLGTRQVVRPG
jgi:glucans biosynthesis protein